MEKMDIQKKAELLNNELLSLLSSRDSSALKVIAKIKRLGIENKDNALIGYAYYRYAYFYYFTKQDLKKFRKYVQAAIQYLLRSDDKEYLGGSYNLIAYDAIDQGAYDIAYAYYMLAIKASRQKKDIALPGLIEANAGRLLIELKDYKKGRTQIKRAIKIISKFKNLHVYDYNMILTYADIALASFLLKDKEDIKEILKETEKYYRQANNEEKILSRTYYLLVKIYYALLNKDEKEISKNIKLLMAYWKNISGGELVGLMFEIESLCLYMLENNYMKYIPSIIKYSYTIIEDDNLSIALRYARLLSKYYEKAGKIAKYKESLYIINQIINKQQIEIIKTRRYSIEFTEMVDAIAKEREKVIKENATLKVLANTDSLTSLPNRNAMNNYLGQKFDEAEANGLLFGIGIIDVDNFKEYNDNYGHQIGDECLKQIGKALLPFLNNPNLFIARYGGDEFVVGYFNLNNKEINKIVKEMKEAVHKETNAFNKLVKEPVEISQGIYNAIPKGKNKLWDFLSKADKKLYKSKLKK